jgi:hypothetical protein
MASAFPSLKRTRTEAMGYDNDGTHNQERNTKARRVDSPVPRAWKRGRDTCDASDPERPSKRQCKIPTAGTPVSFIYYCINALLRRVHMERVGCRDSMDYDRNENDGDDHCGTHNDVEHVEGNDSVHWHAGVHAY